MSQFELEQLSFFDISCLRDLLWVVGSISIVLIETEATTPLFMDSPDERGAASTSEVNLDLTLAKPRVDDQAAPPVVQEPRFHFDLNQTSPVLHEQIIQIDNKTFTVPLERTEMNNLINRLPKEELIDIIGFDTLRHPLSEYPAEQQALLRELSISRFETKNEIISNMKSLYPEDGWDFTPRVREKFFGGRQWGRESHSKELNDMLRALQLRGKYAPVAKRLHHQIRDWDWRSKMVIYHIRVCNANNFLVGNARDPPPPQSHVLSTGWLAGLNPLEVRRLRLR